MQFHIVFPTRVKVSLRNTRKNGMSEDTNTLKVEDTARLLTQVTVPSMLLWQFKDFQLFIRLVTLGIGRLNFRVQILCLTEIKILP